MSGHGRRWVVGSIFSRGAVLVLIAVGGLWPTYLNLLHAYNNERIVGLSHGELWQGFYRAVHHADDFLGREAALSGLFVGTPASFTIGGISFIDPLAALSLIAANPFALGAMVASVLAVLAVVVLFGRAFCSFACPASLFFSSALRIREKTEDRFPALVSMRRAVPLGMRLGLLVGGLVAAVIAGSWVWQLILPYWMISTEIVNGIIGVPLGITYYLFVFIVLADFLVFPGEFCRALCPLGLLLGRTSRSAVVRVRAAQRDCAENCDRCANGCDLHLDPRHGAVSDCSLCGRCVTVCPVKKLAIRPHWPLITKRTAAGLGGAALAVVLSVPADLAAHHYHGLPHYGYFDNYPQAPTEEYIAGNGRFEMNFTLYNFQGMQRADVNQPDDVQLFLVVFDLKNKRVVGGRAQIEIHDGTQRLALWDQQAEQESIYLVHTQLPPSDELRLTVTFDAGLEQPVKLSSEFRLPGEGGRSPLTWFAGGLVVLIVAMVLAGKQKRPAAKGAKGKQ